MDVDLSYQIEELTKSGMLIEFSSFEGDNRKYGRVTGTKTVFTCKIKSYNKFSRVFEEHGKGYGDSIEEAFNRAYDKMNKMGRWE